MRPPNASVRALLKNGVYRPGKGRIRSMRCSNRALAGALRMRCSHCDDSSRCAYFGARRDGHCAARKICARSLPLSFAAAVAVVATAAELQPNAMKFCSLQYHCARAASEQGQVLCVLAWTAAATSAVVVLLHTSASIYRWLARAENPSNYYSHFVTIILIICIDSLQSSLSKTVSLETHHYYSVKISRLNY